MPRRASLSLYPADQPESGYVQIALQLAGEAASGITHAFRQFLHAPATQHGDCLHESLVAEQLAAVSCLGDSIGVEHESVIIG